MAVIRINKTNDYTVMSNTHFKEKKMSLKAKGLLSMMLSLPDNWDYSIEGLVSMCKENETSIKSTLDELKEFGYLEVSKKLPNETKSGRIEYEYNIYETPKQEGKKQEVENLGVENLGVEILGIENQGQLNTNISITKELNTYKKEDIPKGISKKESRFTPPTLDEVRDYCYERKNNIDPSKFIDFYESKGWMIGKNKMKDWKAAVRTWERRDPTPKDDLETRDPELYKRLKNGELPF